MDKKKVILNIVILTLAGFINAFGVVVFLTPLKLIDGGFSGTSFVLSQASPYISFSVALIIINFPFYILGYKKIGLTFVFYSLYTISIYSLFAFIFQSLTVDIAGSVVTGNDMLLSAIFGGLISGVGSGITIRKGGALDGVEVLSVIFAKKLGISVGTFVMLYNIILYSISGFLFAAWTIPLYSIIAYAVGLRAVDFIIEGIDSEKGAMIITQKSAIICQKISESFGKGITIMPATGFFSKEKKDVIYIVLNRFQITRLKKIVRDNDPIAFVTITNISDMMHNKVD